jgi:predicted TIM-barrel fold metal-dependent hydrolase
MMSIAFLALSAAIALTPPAASQSVSGGGNASVCTSGISHANQREGGPLPPAAVDHHLHIQGAEVTAELRRRASRSPEEFKGIDPALLNSRTGADALRALDEAGIKQGVLLSEAYTIASPFGEADHLDVAAVTRRENQYNVDAALGSGGRLKAFIGVNPLAPNALDEIHYWMHRKGVSGVKMQLGNSRFNPRSDGDLAKLAKVFDEARAADLPIVIHVRSDTDYTRADAQRFIDQVLPHAGDLPIQIAHAGGYGGLDEATLSALSAYAVAIEHNAPGTKKLVFDLAVVLVRDAADATNAELLKRLAQLIREIGLSRFVVGSDWPSLCSPRDHNNLLESQLPLTSAEWHVILNNRAPYFR